jgi:hypothetical protein
MAEVGTGDAFRVTMRDFEYVLEHGIKVSLVYGDRDSRCPWTAAEETANAANYTGHDNFLKAGYEMISTNETYQGGAVKQFENFSFSRIFNAGHAVNAYQPETVLRVFSRTIGGKDVATGQKQVVEGYSTEGPQSSWTMIEQTLFDAPPTCMVLGSFQDTSPWALLKDTESEGNGTGTPDETQNSAANSGHLLKPAQVIFTFLLVVVVNVF